MDNVTMQNGQPFTKLEARACMALKSIMFCKSQIARLAAYQTLQGTPTCDWLLEQGLITVRLSNPTTQFSNAIRHPNGSGVVLFNPRSRRGDPRALHFEVIRFQIRLTPAI